MSLQTDHTVGKAEMYRVRRWDHDREEMTEEFVNVLDGIAVDGASPADVVP